MNVCDRCKGETALLHEISPHWLPKGAPVTRFCQYCTDVVNDAIFDERNRTGNGTRKFKLYQRRIEKKLGAKDWSAFDSNLRQQAWQVAYRWHRRKLHKEVRQAIKPIR